MTEADGGPRAFTASDLFIATGVRPHTEEIGLDEIGDKTDRQALSLTSISRQQPQACMPLVMSLGISCWRRLPRKKAITPSVLG